MSRRRNRRPGFTLIELLGTMAILIVLLVILASVSQQVRGIYRSSMGKSEQFREARTAFEAVVSRVAQATLNTYWDYDDPQTPTRYQRQSEMRFKSGPARDLVPGPAATHPSHALFFQAPFGLAETASINGLNDLLNTWGYFIEYGDDSGIRPAFLGAAGVPLRPRFRLLELSDPTERFELPGRTGSSKQWFTDALGRADARPVRVLAENIILLVVWPRLSPREDADGSAIAPAYHYSTAPGDPDSPTRSGNGQPIWEHQLPPIVQITMVSIDEAAARRLAESAGGGVPDLIDPGWFTTASESQFQNDLTALEARLNEWRIPYRVFNAAVPIRGAKWSQN